MGKISLILGGVRSGKSRYAVKLAHGSYKRVGFLATCQALDNEMKNRIGKHQKERPKNWATLEEPIEIATTIKKNIKRYDLILVDCLTLWVSNCMLSKVSAKHMEKIITDILSVARKSRLDIIFVSNEVGLGIVPDNKLARDFRDTAGRINQLVARKADSVTFMVAGIPWRVK